MTDDKEIHNLGVPKTEYVGCSHEELTEWYNNNEIINYFKGAVEVDSLVLDSNVPDTFPDYQTITTEEVEEQYNEEQFNEDTGEIDIEIKTRTITQPVLDDDGNVIMRPKTFREYCGNNYHDSINVNKVLIPIGSRNNNGNRANPVMSDELYIWIDYFGIENTRTKSEWLSFISIIEDEE